MTDIAALEFERNKADRKRFAAEALNKGLANRIVELEADAKLLVFLHALAIEEGYVPGPGESVYDFLQRAIQTGSPKADRARRTG